MFTASFRPVGPTGAAGRGKQMRTFTLAVACIAVVAGAGVIRANGTGSAAAGIGLFAAGPITPQNIVPGPSGFRHALDAAAGFGKPDGQPQRREHPIRLAQSSLAVVMPEVAAPEATTGNPSQAPFKWAGLLVVPSPTQKDPNSITMCTAEFITPSVLLTAGHCLKDLLTNPAGPWPDPTNGAFWLQYQNDSGTTFKIVCAATNPLWTLPSNYASMSSAQQEAAQVVALQHDFAMILVEGTSPTGVMPYALDWKGKAAYAHRIGYPVDILDAAIVQEVPGFVFFADAIPMGHWSSPNLVVQWGPVTDATNGMSGGAWVVNPSSTEGPNNNILIAVTSFSALEPDGSPVFPGGTFAAYLTANEFNPLLTSVQNGCK
jgi:hypothetical protein